MDNALKASTSRLKAETNASEDARCGFCLTDTKHVCLPAGTDMLAFIEGVEKMIKGKCKSIYALTHGRMYALTHAKGKRD